MFGLPRYLGITGGGAIKYKEDILKLGINYDKKDEIASLISGLNFAIKNFENEVFIYDWRTKIKLISNEKINYPYLLVNIGSGVSIMKVYEDGKFERVTGTSLGGGTFWGLSKMLTGISDFKDVEELSDIGDNKKVDLLVSDIYGGDYEDIGLPGYVIASSFAKVTNNNNLNTGVTTNNTNTKVTNNFDREDIIKSLLYMISDNICQIAYLSIKHDEDIKDVLFTGSFMTAGPVLWKKLSYGIEFWSKDKMKAKFLKHEGYFGALGCQF